MGYTKEPLIAVVMPDRKSIHIKLSANPQGPSLSTHWINGRPHGGEAIGNAALDTQRAALYQLARGMLSLKSEDPVVISLQREAKLICHAISTQIQALRAPQEDKRA